MNNRRITHHGRRAVQAGIVVLAAGCASAATVTPKTEVHLEPVRSASPSSDAPRSVPALPTLNADASLAGEVSSGPRVASLTAVNQDLPVVLRELAGKFGLQYHIDPGIHGTVNTTLRDKTLPEALAAIVPAGVSYQVQNGVLRVAPARVATRIFSLDYVALSRVGTASTIIQRRLGNASFNSNAVGAGGASFGLAGAGSGGGADVISAVSVADVWEEIRVAVEALLFQSNVPNTERQTQSAGLTGGGIGSAGRPYSRVGEDGRRLIINPISGTITVSGFPGDLDQIETFIRAFESSIQRQVLIEAKIVEVNLDRSFQFGIDWNLLASRGTTALGVASTLPTRAPRAPGGAPTGNVELTLTGGSGKITAVLNALSSQGDVRVLSSPRVSALNNQRAVFDVTTGEIVFNVTQTPIISPNGTTTFQSQVTPTQVNVGIVLDVLPQIGSDNTVTMNIRPVVTSVARTATFTVPGGDGAVVQAPVIDTRESDTMARLRAGETIIIGGLMQTRREKVRSGVPGLMNIPLLGRLFTNYNDVERKAELVIFLTPTIIAGQPVATR